MTAIERRAPGRLETVDSQLNMEVTAAPGWELNSALNKRWYVHLFPSLTDFAFLLPFFLLFALLPGAQLLLSDGDTGWHIRTGDWILAHRMVPTQDIFSFTKPHEAWFAWEWGWDVIFATIHRFWGLDGVVFVTAILLGLVAALLFRLIRRCSNNDAIAVPFTLLAVCASMMHWLARPHLVSWIFILIFLHVIRNAEEGNPKGLYGLPLLMLAWTNLHAGFFIGIALLAASVCAEGIKALQGRNAWRMACLDGRPYLVSLAGCIAATFVNPYTWRLHRHVAAYLRDSKLLDNIQEFQSINFHRPSAIFIESVLLLGIAAAFWCFRRQKIASGLTILLWAHLALVSSRNAPIFVIVSMPWIAAMSLEFARCASCIYWLRKLSSTISEISEEFRPLERIERWHVVSIGTVLFVAYLFAAGKPGFAAQFNVKNIPIQKTAVLRAVEGSRLFTSDEWGDYLIYRGYPSARVFMDGRSDFYGDKFISVYQHIMSAQYDWRADLDRFGIDAVMVKPDAPIASLLKQVRGWKTVYDDGSVIVFRAQPAGHAAQDACPERAGIGSGARNNLGISHCSQVNDSNSTLKLDERRSL